MLNGREKDGEEEEEEELEEQGKEDSLSLKKATRDPYIYRVGTIQ